MMKRSPLQKDVLRLYRNFQRAILTKPKNVQPDFHKTIRAAFEENQKIPRTQIPKIELLIRQGQRQLKIVKSSSCKQISRPK